MLIFKIRFRGELQPLNMLGGSTEKAGPTLLLVAITFVLPQWTS